MRLAANLAKRDGVNVRVVCLGDAVSCALAGQTVPGGYYHLDRMITSAARLSIGLVADPCRRTF